jgi:hypothetical protein
MPAVWVGAVAALAAVACVTSEVTQAGPPPPSRRDDCAVEVFVSGPPNYPAIDIASAHAECNKLGGRHKCMTELRREACRAGADTMYGVVETAGPDHTYVTATLALRDKRINVTRKPTEVTAAEVTPATPQPAAAPDRPCDPICSPGFACAAGQCIPQCNPPCEAGETCNRKRLCEPAAAGAQTTAASPPPPPPPGARPPLAPPPSPAQPGMEPSWPPPAGSKPAPPIIKPRAARRSGKAYPAGGD